LIGATTGPHGRPIQTIEFVAKVHSIYVQVSDDEWADPAFKIKLKNRLEANPVVLRIDESDEPDWKSIAKAAQAEAASLGKQLADALKRLNELSVEPPCFAILNPKNG
jgi:hypothetical protein